MKRIAACFVLAGSLILTAGCRMAETPSSGQGASPVPVLTEKDFGSVCRMTAGECRMIRVRENPTTGYCWKFFIPADGIVESVKSDFKAPDGRLCGAPGMREWTFRAVRSGRCEILGIYSRPWEKLQPGKAQKFLLTLVIDPVSR